MYKEEFYKLPKKKSKNFSKKILLILFLVTVLIFLLVYFYFLQNTTLIGIFIFEEQVLKAPCEGVFKTDLKDMEKVRIGQLLGYIEEKGKNKNFEIDILNKEYIQVMERLDYIGERINSIVDEIRINIFINEVRDLNNYMNELKRLSKERLQLLIKLEEIKSNISKELGKEKYKNGIYSLKSGYVVFTIDTFVANNIYLNNIEPKNLKKFKYVNSINKKVKKDTILGVVRDPNPKHLILFYHFPLENIDKGKYIIIRTNRNYQVKAKILEIEFLKNFYKITTLPIEFDNIILKERIIEGQIIKIL